MSKDTPPPSWYEPPDEEAFDVNTATSDLMTALGLAAGWVLDGAYIAAEQSIARASYLIREIMENE